MIAILVHIVILILPQSANPFALFWKERELPEPEPVVMRFDQQPQQQEMHQPDIIEKPEEQEAITPEESQEPPQTEQPQIRGNTNMRSLEAPPQQQPNQPEPGNEPPPVEETGERMAEEPREAERRPEPRPDPRRQERSQRLENALQEFRDLPIGEVPIEYDNDRPSSAEHAEGTVQFDTYNWNYEPYRARMLRKIYTEWVPRLRRVGFFNMGQPGRSILSFRIEKNGSVTALLLRADSGIDAYDEVAKYSIIADYPGLSTEFPPLPIDFPKEFLGVTIGYFVNMDIPRRDQESR